MRNYRSVSLPDYLIDRVEQLIGKLGTYGTIAEFVREAVRLRVESLEKTRSRKKGGGMA